MKHTYPLIIEMIDDITLNQPYSTAVIELQNEFDYKTLNHVSTACANAYIQNKINKYDVIAIIGHVGFLQIAAQLGAWKIGSIILTIDPTLPNYRIEQLIEEAKVKLITSDGRSNKAEAISKKIKCNFLNLQEVNTEEVIDSPIIKLKPDDPAYIIFTSGSTGRPKGILGSHKGLSHFISWQCKEFNIRPTDRCAQLTSVVFDVVFRSIFTPLCSGAAVVIPPTPNLSSSIVLPWMKEKTITMVHLVPSLAKLWLAENVKYSLPLLRYVFFAGEKLHSSLLERWHEIINSPVEFINLYGPSETILAKSFNRITNKDFKGVYPVGQALPETQVLIMRNRKTHCKDGDIGEVVIKTPFRSLGYLEEVRESGFSDDLYFTGDIGFYNGDNELEILGRKDHQIKYNGVRIETEEIEVVLDAHQKITSSCVTTRKYKNVEYLVAFIISSMPININEVRDYLETKLSQNMLPNLYVSMERLPYTKSGKLDRNALPQIDENTNIFRNNSSSTETYSDTERRLLTIWHRTLNFDNINLHENFFTIGGDSLKAMSILTEIVDEFGVYIPQATIMQYPTIAKQAKYIESRLNSKIYIPPKLNVNETNSKEFPLSINQEEYWYYYSNKPSSPVYNVYKIFKIKGSLDSNVLELALIKVVRKHALLGTRFFEENDGKIKQTYAEPRDNILEQFNLPSEKSLQNEIKKIITRPFDLLNEHPYKFTLLTTIGSQYFLLNFHHIVVDGWSSSLILKTISQYYERLISRQKIEQQVVEVGYQYYVAQQNDWLNSKECNDSLQYWEKELNNVSPTEIPPDYNIKRTFSYKGSELTSRINKNDIEKFCKKKKVTTYVFFYTALNIFLHRYTQSRKVTIGSPVSNRENPQTQNIVGPLVNVLVFTLEINPEQNLENHLKNAQEKVIKNIQYQNTPFTTVYSHLLKKKNITPGQRLFSIFFYLEEESEFTLKNVETERLEENNNTSKFDISIRITPTKQSFKIDIEYDINLYRQETIELLLNRFKRFVNKLQLSPSIPINQLNLDDTEKLSTLSIVKGQTIPLGTSALIDIFHNKNRTERIAIEDKGKTINYNTFFKKVDAMCDLIKSHKDFHSHTPIAVCMDRSMDAVLAMMAILKSGGIYVPINMHVPESRIQKIIHKCEPLFIITNSVYEHKIKNLFKHVINIEKTKLENKTEHPVINSLKYPAYIVFTSGTTGEPKAILQSHRMLTNLTKWQSTQIKNKHHRIAMFSSFGFDVSIQEVFYCFYTNSTLCIVPEETKKDARELWKFLIKNNVDILFVPPQALYMLCYIDDWVYAGKCPLKYIIVAGEALKIGDNERRFFSKFKDTKLINQYGPSETHVVTSYEMPSDRTKWLSFPPIGLPLQNSEIIIVDKQGIVQPKDIIGEVYVAGVNLAESYYKNPEQTNAKFIQNPYKKSNYQKAYRTGDLAKINVDNQLVYFGRADRQAKVLGYRIELSDIESNLSDEPNVNMCAVALRNISGRDILAAYVVPDIDDYDTETYKFFLNGRLPNYMIPQFFIHLNSLPITENGKVDIRALPAPKVELTAIKKASTETQRTLLGIWNDLLNLKQINIDVNANFFELGGTSLLAVKMLVNIERLLKTSLKTKIIYENPTIEQLSSYIEKKEHDRFDLLPIYKAPEAESFPLTDQQTIWWILNKLSSSTSSNIQFIISLDRNITKGQLKNALNQLAEENFVLRISIEEEAGIPSQKLNDKATPSIIQIDLTNKNTKLKEEHINNLLDEDSFNPINLDVAPLYRVILFKYDITRTLLYFCFHHIISDEWSTEIFKEKLLASLDGKKYVIPYDYEDYAFTQRKWKSKSLLDSRERFWRSMINSSSQDVKLNYDKRAKLKYGLAKRVHVRIDDKKEVSYFTKHLMTKNITTFHAVLSLYRLLIYFFTTHINCLIGVPFLNRNHFEFYEILGLFTNTVPVNIPINKNASFIELCCQTQKIIHSVRDNIEYTFGPEDKLETFNFMFVYNDSSRNENINTLYGTRKNTQFDLNLIAINKLDHLKFIFEYNSDLFNEETIQNIANVFKHLIHETTNNQLKRISQYKINSSYNEDKIIKKLCHAPTLSIPFQNAFDIFENTAMNNPKKICLHNHNQETKMSYQFVLNRAQQIAKMIYGQSNIIGIFLHRGTDMIIAILGCLRAGIPYVPLDPSYPELQLEYMYNQSNLDCVLVNTETLDLTNAAIIRKVPSLINLDEVKPSHNIMNLPKPTLNDLAYIIYTSGSTGKPKGVMVTHGNLVNTICTANQFLKLSKHSHFSQFFSINFDASLLDTFLCFTNESTLYIIDDSIRKQPRALIQFYLNNKINVASLTPALLSILPHTELPKLESIIVGGDVIEQSAADYWSKNRNLYNAYGPTETTIVSSIHKYQTGDNIRNVGKPLNNFTYYILNKNVQLLPTGVVGELYIGGLSVAKGYLNRDDLTKERFFSIPNIDNNSKLYKTGDLAYWDSQGDIIFVGRNDSQIKFRGYRIELGNIEAALSQLSYIDQCVVLLTNYSGASHLTAYFTVNDPSKNEINIKNRLRKLIPDYMMPTQYVQVGYLPMTPNGKIDKRNLPKHPIHLSFEKVPPSTYLEKRIARIWADVLGLSIENIGITDSFYDIGGQSLSLASMVTELIAQLNISVNYSGFMSNPTIQFIIQQHTPNTNILPAARNDVKQALADIQVDFKINTSKKKPNFRNPNDILLTGATGFVGQYLLQELLDKTNARIHCLSRNPNKISIKSSRIIHYSSDLAKPNLSLKKEEYKHLADNIDMVYHCGAYVNHILDYHALRHANVFGTKVLLELMTMGKPKCFNYISTISCAMAEDENGNFIETWSSNEQPTKSNGYVISKWAAENLVEKAKKANYQCSILRLGNVTGDTRTGYSMIDVNHIYLFLKGCLQMGYAPEMNTFVEMTPVDILAKAIYALSLNEEAQGSILHLNNPLLISWDDLLRYFVKSGGNVELIPFSEWQKKYLNKIDESNALYPLKVFYMGDHKFIYKHYGTIKAQYFLKKLGVKYPDDYTELLKLYDKFSRELNFF